MWIAQFFNLDAYVLPQEDPEDATQFEQTSSLMLVLAIGYVLAFMLANQKTTTGSTRHE